MSDPGITLRKEIQKNFPQFGSIRVNAVYQSMDDMAYDPDTGVATPSIEATAPIKVILGSLSVGSPYIINQGDDTAVLGIDKNALFPALDLPFDPKIGDVLVIGSTSWRVKGVSSDPATAAWSLWIRPNQTPYVSP